MSRKATSSYDDLLRRYQGAWDQIFVRRLEDCGEKAMADLYRCDPEAFERRYQAGCRYLREPVAVRRPSAPTTSSRSHPAWTSRVPSWSGSPGQGGRFRPRWETPTSSPGIGIAAMQVAACLVYVRYRDARRACEVLAAACAQLAESLPSWACCLAAGGWRGNGTSAGSAAGRRTARAPQPAEEAAPPGGWPPASLMFAAAAATVMMVVLFIGRARRD